jgi:LacI family transcriptional regulator
VAALLAAGHRRIAFVGSSESLYTHRERLAGYREALVAAGLAVEPCLVRTDAPDIAAAARAARELLDAAVPPTAVFAGNNRAAIGVLEARRDRCPSLGLVGFDDFDLAATLGLSVVAHDPERMGAVATELALRRAVEPMGVVEQVVLPTRLVLRGSERAAG